MGVSGILSVLLPVGWETDVLSVVYAFSSFLALDPWHMFTSFVPYILLSPMYINVLNMCVLSDSPLHDWS